MRDRIIRRLQHVRLSRESLIRMALGIFLGFIALSVVISFIHDRPQDLSSEARGLAFEKGRYEAEQFLVERLREDPEQREAWITLCQLRSGGTTAEARLIFERVVEEFEREGFRLPDRVTAPVNNAPFLSDAEFDEFIQSSPVEIEVLRAWSYADDLDRALAQLVPLEDSVAAQLTGASICVLARKRSRALEYYDGALRIEPANSEAINGRFRTLQSLGRDAEVELALEDPIVRAAIDPRHVFDYFHEKKDYIHAFPPLLRMQYQRWSFGIWITCLTIGACWMLFTFHLGVGWSWRRTIQWLVPIALVLGWVSADLTLGSVIVFDDWLGDEGNKGIPWHMLHALLIGVREEFWKLLLFVPLLPYLLRAASEVQAIALASIVGLGFAVNENANYYLMSGGHGILGRFLTANFLHMALTGYAGYFLFRALRQKTKAQWIEAGEALAKVMFFHGAYDFFIIAPQLEDWGFLSMILFILISQQYLRLFFHIRPHRSQRVSSTRIFVATLATATGMHYLYLSTQLGIGAAVWHTFGGLLGMAIITFMYFHEFDERVA